jgi:hypothetical protein
LLPKGIKAETTIQKTPSKKHSGVNIQYCIVPMPLAQEQTQLEERKAIDSKFFTRTKQQTLVTIVQELSILT